MIIGVTGYYSSGKDTIANYLEKKGFIHHSLSDEIRLELKKRKKRITRDNLILVGNELRQKYGPSVLADRATKRFKTGNYVVSSIRNVYEVKALRKLDNFMLIDVRAPIEKRFRWMKKRDRKGDIKTLKELRQKELLEQSADPII
jgi:dephospho-CoA kinase